MLNQVVLVGRLTKDPELINTDSGKQKVIITLAVNRPFKNVDGIYETDFIKCILWNGIATNTTEYCRKGDVIGLKGRLQTSSYDNEEGKKIYNTDVIAERISFINSNKKDDSKEEIADEPKS